jgi:hypothetical protein
MLRRDRGAGRSCVICHVPGVKADNKSGGTPDFTRETRVLHQAAALCRVAATPGGIQANPGYSKLIKVNPS